MARRRQRRPRLDVRDPDFPDVGLGPENDLDPDPHELYATGRATIDDFKPGGKWDPLRPRPRFRPYWWHRWKNGARPIF